VSLRRNTVQLAVYQSFWRALEKKLLGGKRAEIRSVRARANCRSALRHCTCDFRASEQWAELLTLVVITERWCAETGDDLNKDGGQSAGGNLERPTASDVSRETFSCVKQDMKVNGKLAYYVSLFSRPMLRTKFDLLGNNSASTESPAEHKALGALLFGGRPVVERRD